MIPYGRQDISEADLAAVAEVLRSDWLTQGPAVPAFEAAVARYCGAGHAVAVNSATSALHLAYLALGLAPGKLLWTTPNTFVATANAARMCGADVDFVDIDPHSYNLCARALESKLAEAEQAGRLPQVVAPVHFAGQACDMAEIRRLADRYDFAIVEDASHAIGGDDEAGKIGNGSHADCTVFSFHPVKLITTGEGGMILCNRPELAERMRLLRSHGISRDPAAMTQAPDGDWYYQQLELGYNYRMTDMQAALGLSQLARLDDFVARRRALVARYDQRLAGARLTLPAVAHGHPAWHLYVVLLADAGQRRTVFDVLRAAGIGVNVHYIPVHLQPYYQALGFAQGNFPAAENYYERALTLPLHPRLTESEQDYVVEQLLCAIERSSAA